MAIWFLNKPELICLHTLKWFQVLLYNTNSFICTQINGFEYWCLTLVVSNGFKSIKWLNIGGARGVMVIVVGNEHGDTSSNPGRDWFHFT